MRLPLGIIPEEIILAYNLGAIINPGDFFHAGKSRPHNYRNTTTSKTELLISPQPTLPHHRSHFLPIRYIICGFRRPSEPAIATHQLA
jgi:hypothetical protein